jgi:hypothetical protein
VGVNVVVTRVVRRAVVDVIVVRRRREEGSNVWLRGQLG